MRIPIPYTSDWARLLDFSPRGSTPYIDCCSLIPPVCGLADEPIHLQESILPDLMEEPVDKYLEIRYNSYGIFLY